jgi:outer membrane protein W
MKGRAMHAEHNAYQPLHTHHQPADSTAANTTTRPGQTKAYRYPRNLGLRYFMGMTFRHVAGEGNAGTFGAWRKIKIETARSRRREDAVSLLRSYLRIKPFQGRR